MILYAVILFGMSALFGIIAALIYKGKTELIHSYHQKKVTDRAGYGKAFGKAMAVIAGAMGISGAIALLGESAMAMAVAALLAGLAAGTVAIFRVQKKYNGGMF